MCSLFLGEQNQKGLDPPISEVGVYRAMSLGFSFAVQRFVTSPQYIVLVWALSSPPGSGRRDVHVILRAFPCSDPAMLPRMISMYYP